MKLSKLEEYVSNHPESREVLSALATRKRNRKGVDVSRLIRQMHANNTRIAVQDIMNTFSAMEDAEIGKLERLSGGRLQFNTNENILAISNGILIARKEPKLAAKVLDHELHKVIIKAGKLEIVVDNLQDAVEIMKKLG